MLHEGHDDMPLHMIDANNRHVPDSAECFCKIHADPKAWLEPWAMSHRNYINIGLFVRL